MTSDCLKRKGADWREHLPWTEDSWNDTNVSLKQARCHCAYEETRAAMHKWNDVVKEMERELRLAHSVRERCFDECCEAQSERTALEALAVQDAVVARLQLDLFHAETHRRKVKEEYMLAWRPKVTADKEMHEALNRVPVLPRCIVSIAPLDIRHA